MWQDFQEGIRDVIWARGFVILKGSEGGYKCIVLENSGKESVVRWEIGCKGFKGECVTVREEGVGFVCLEFVISFPLV